MGFLTDSFVQSFYTADDEATLNYFRSFGLDTDRITSTSELSESIYFICLKHLSETMSKMPWIQRQHTKERGFEKVLDPYMDYVLNVRPNPYYSASTFWGTCEFHKQHSGNAFAYIETAGPMIKHLWLLPSDEVQIWRDNAGIFGKSNAIWYVWTDSRTGEKWTFSSEEILHFKTGVTFNGIVGLSVKEILKTQIQSRMYSEGFLKKLYENNMFGSKILVHYTGDLNKGAEENLVSKLEQFSQKKGSGKYIPLPLGMEAKLLDMKLSDAQFFENNQVSALQLAAAFGIKPNVINDYSKSSYSNSESQQLDFYVNTLQPSFLGYEQEVTYKLLPLNDVRTGMRWCIQEKVLFKMDSKTQAEVLKMRMNNFMITPNQAAEELGEPYYDDPMANKLLGNGNYIPIDKVGTQWINGGEE